MIYPNKENAKFSDYAFALMVMNAFHGLTGHNRKYYFNAILNEFEPMYYDGTPKIDYPLDIEKLQKSWGGSTLIEETFKDGLNKEFILRFKQVISSDDLKVAFEKRTHALDIDAENFFQVSMQRALKNIDLLADLISNLEVSKPVNVERGSLEALYCHRKSFG